MSHKVKCYYCGNIFDRDYILYCITNELVESAKVSIEKNDDKKEQLLRNTRKRRTACK